MATTTNRNPACHFSERSSLLGVVEFYPRIAIVVIFLTIVVAVAGWRIFRESGAPRINALADEAIAAFVSLQEEKAPAFFMDFAEAEKRILDFSGVSLKLPEDASGFTVSAVDRRTMRKRPAIGVRFSYEDGHHMLVVFRKENFLGRKPLASFPDESLLSGEHDGCSFVFWERDGASFIMVSDTDVIQTFKLVRGFFA
ncbi:MAG: hypothetical protein FWF95_06140 [Syntrophorhabdaceae bacterium]|nr:hypothetical protein [Syntrophorhabdaceae bacterium]